MTAATDARPLAVITGASSGIGLELAKQFAAHDFDLMVCAEDPGITRVAEQIDQQVGVQPVIADLRSDEGVTTLADAVRATGRPVAALALNAGVGGIWGPFVDTPWDGDRDIVMLNVLGTVHLAKELVPAMVARGEGRVLFTSSVAATMPGPYYASYAASKAFVQSFSHALRHELKDSGVTVTALLPGATDTEFFQRARMEGAKVDDAKKDDPAEVAKDGFDALMAGKDQVVGGPVKNAAQVLGTKMLPDKVKAVLHAGLSAPKDE